MTAECTWDVFSTLDGYGSYGADGDWGGYWGKQGPELLEHRAALFDAEVRMVFGATTFRENAEIMTSGIDPNTLDEWNVRTMRMPATVISSTLHDTSAGRTQPSSAVPPSTSSLDSRRSRRCRCAPRPACR